LASELSDKVAGWLWGAKPRDILVLVSREGFVLLAIGTAIGMGTSLALTRFMAALLAGISPSDPVTFVVVGLGFGSAETIESLVPVRRATKVDPMITLRCDQPVS
jgi:ABC-type antimicrobial peptide transport system permease subunit